MSKKFSYTKHVTAKKSSGTPKRRKSVDENVDIFDYDDDSDDDVDDDHKTRRRPATRSFSAKRRRRRDTGALLPLQKNEKRKRTTRDNKGDRDSSDDNDHQYHDETTASMVPSPTETGGPRTFLSRKDTAVASSSTPSAARSAKSSHRRETDAIPIESKREIRRSDFGAYGEKRKQLCEMMDDTDDKQSSVLISGSVLATILDHAYSDCSIRPVLGLLGGSFDETENVLNIDACHATKRDDSYNGVKCSDAELKIAEAHFRDQDKNRVINGWYRSRPSAPPFPDEMDLLMQHDVQRHAPHAIGIICSTYIVAMEQSPCSDSSSEEAERLLNEDITKTNTNTTNVASLHMPQQPNHHTFYFNCFRVRRNPDNDRLEAIKVEYRVKREKYISPLMQKEMFLNLEMVLKETKQTYEEMFEEYHRRGLENKKLFLMDDYHRFLMSFYRDSILHSGRTLDESIYVLRREEKLLQDTITERWSRLREHMHIDPNCRSGVLQGHAADSIEGITRMLNDFITTHEPDHNTKPVDTFGGQSVAMCQSIAFHLNENARKKSNIKSDRCDILSHKHRQLQSPRAATAAAHSTNEDIIESDTGSVDFNKDIEEMTQEAQQNKRTFEKLELLPHTPSNGITQLKSARIGPRKYSLQDFLTFKLNEDDGLQYGRIEQMNMFKKMDGAVLRATLFINANSLDEASNDIVKGMADLDHEQALFVRTTRSVPIHWKKVVDRVDIRNSENYKKLCNEGQQPELAGVFVTSLLYDTELGKLEQSDEDWSF